jgi:hypothetical protein
MSHFLVIGGVLDVRRGSKRGQHKLPEETAFVQRKPDYADSAENTFKVYVVRGRR